MGGRTVRPSLIGLVFGLGLAPLAARAEDGLPRIHAGEGLAGLFSEIRGGVAWPDQAIKEHGPNINGEVLFVSRVPASLTADLPTTYRWMLEPRVHLGFSGNPSGYTSYGYAGLTWTTMLTRDVLRP